MADTSAQKKAAEWVRGSFLKSKFGKPFSSRACVLGTGGRVEFSAVSQDGRIVGFISTSTPLVPNGTVGRGKLSKARADALFLSMLQVDVQKYLIYTNEGMANLVLEEKRAGRLPSDIKVLHVSLPEQIESEVTVSRKRASQELSNV